MKLTPPSSAARTSASASPCCNAPILLQTSPVPPNVMVPRQSSETNRPVWPRRFMRMVSTRDGETTPACGLAGPDIPHLSPSDRMASASGRPESKVTEHQPPDPRRPTTATLRPGSFASVLERNIASLEKRRESQSAKATLQTRIAEGVTRFSGSMVFVYIHLVIIVFWVAVNAGLISFIPPVRPPPSSSWRPSLRWRRCSFPPSC